MATIFKMYFRIIRETKHQTGLYGIHHRIIPCNGWAPQNHHQRQQHSACSFFFFAYKCYYFFLFRKYILHVLVISCTIA